MTKRLIGPLSLVVAMVFLLGACGDDDASNAAGDATTTTTAAADSTTTTAGGGSTPDLSGDCAFLGTFGDAGLEGAVDPSAMLGGNGPVDFAEVYGPLADQFARVADNAPDEIQSSFQTLADGFREVADKLDGVTIDPSDPSSMDAETMAKLQELSSTFDADFQAAATDVEAWINANCTVTNN